MLCGSNCFSKYNINDIDILHGFWYNEIKDRLIYEYGDYSENSEKILMRARSKHNIAGKIAFPSVAELYSEINTKYWISPVIKCYDAKHNQLKHSRIINIKKIENRLSPVVKMIDFYNHSVRVTYDTKVYSSILKELRYFDRDVIFLKYDNGEPVSSNVKDIIRKDYCDSVYEVELEKKYYYPYIRHGFIMQ